MVDEIKIETRVALYARVSTSDQNCEMQLRALREYVAFHKWQMAPIEHPEGMTIHTFLPRKFDAPTDGLCRACNRGVQHAGHTGKFAEYVDAGQSGAKVSRPELDRLMTDARAKKVGCIIVWKLDRWGRSFMHLIETVQELGTLGVRWLSATQASMDTDASNPMTRLLFNIMASFAEWEREMLRERTGYGQQQYVKDFKAGKVGITRISRSKKNEPVGHPRAIFHRGRAAEMRARGLSWSAIATAVGASRSAVRRELGKAAK